MRPTCARPTIRPTIDRKSTRLNSSHRCISYAVFCLEKFLFANPLGFVVPPAGLQYSGAVAAAAWRVVRRRRPRGAVGLGFAHRGGPPVVSFFNIEEPETPLAFPPADRLTM